MNWVFFVEREDSAGSKFGEILLAVTHTSVDWICHEITHGYSYLRALIFENSYFRRKFFDDTLT